MIMRTLLVLAAIAGVPEMASAASRVANEAACRPDVRRFCNKVAEGAGDNAFLSCLKLHRSQLSSRCLRVLDENAQ